MLDVRRLGGVDCGTDHSVVVAKFRERLSVRKLETQNFKWWKTSNIFATSENIHFGLEIKLLARCYTISKSL
jgi:hypothetical protein